MKRYFKLVVYAAVLSCSANTFAAAGPTLTKELSFTVKNRPTLAATWTPVTGLDTDVIKTATVIGNLSINSAYLQSVTIKSTDSNDLASSGNVTFSKNGGGSFKTSLSSTSSDVTVTNQTGGVMITAKSSGSNLPNTVPIKFTTVANATSVPAGDYTATVNLNSVVL